MNMTCTCTATSALFYRAPKRLRSNATAVRRWLFFTPTTRREIHLLLLPPAWSPGQRGLRRPKVLYSYSSSSESSSASLSQLTKGSAASRTFLPACSG